MPSKKTTGAKAGGNKAPKMVLDLRKRSAEIAKSATTKATLTARIPVELYATLVDIQEQHHATLSEIVRDCLEIGVSRWADGLRPTVGQRRFSPRALVSLNVGEPLEGRGQQPVVPAFTRRLLQDRLDDETDAQDPAFQASAHLDAVVADLATNTPSFLPQSAPLPQQGDDE